MTDVPEVTISELDETHPMIRQFVMNAGLDLDPAPIRRLACAARNAADVVVCAGCGVVIELRLPKAT